MSQRKESKPSITVDDAGGQNAEGTTGSRVIVNGVEYALGDISAEARQLITQMRAADQELHRHQAIAAMIHAARQTWGAELAELLRVK